MKLAEKWFDWFDFAGGKLKRTSDGQSYAIDGGGKPYRVSARTLEHQPIPNAGELQETQVLSIALPSVPSWTSNDARQQLDEILEDQDHLTKSSPFLGLVFEMGDVEQDYNGRQRQRLTIRRK